MDIPNDLLYSKTHEWVKILDDGNALIGLTDYAQEQLTDVVFLNLCEPGEQFQAGEPIGDAESIDAVTEVMTPISGTVVKVNDEVLDDPSLINSGPFDAWLVELTDISETDDLLSPVIYASIIKE